jgi:hypothetical protein
MQPNDKNEPLLETVRRFFEEDEWPFEEMEGQTILRTGFRGEKSSWDASKEMNENFLYNLAVWYAIAHSSKVDGDGAKKQARRYLAYSLARDQEHDLWSWAGKDPDLKDVRDGLEDLKFALKRKQLDVPNLHSLTGNSFAERIDDILKEAG